jgi:hypothetical protein
MPNILSGTVTKTGAMAKTITVTVGALSFAHSDQLYRIVLLPLTPYALVDFASVRTSETHQANRTAPQDAGA